MHPDQLATMAQEWAHGQELAIAALDLPVKTEAWMFEVSLDTVCDQLPLSDAAWDLFAATARLKFFGVNDAPAADRKRWAQVADRARADMMDELRDDAVMQCADYRNAVARDAA
jgi:hypothetical protein